MNEIPLRDIHLPGAVSWWPPALGWWLAGLALIVLIPGFIFLRRWIKHKSLKKLTSIEFKNIVEKYDQQHDNRRLLSQLSSLLRRVLMSYLGRNSSAAVTGDEWIKQLNILADMHCFSPEQEALLRQGQFQRELDFDSLALINSCESWIKGLPRSQQHVSV
ncbi:MAG: DUF4381 domain-containing protein [Gammaproteobacteria bacterium]|nr:DUF4381 domain-containing protein [Gammaproteobacteria bacterium]